MALDWGWSLGGKGNSGGVSTQSASTSGNDILATLLGQSNPNVTGNSMLLSSGGATTSAVGVTDPAGTTATPYAPPPYDRWQGGAKDPNGTQAPNGRQTGGRLVDPTYQTDATGRPLTPDEQAGWRAYDTARANASTREQDSYWAWKNAQNASTGGTGSKAVFDARTKTWSVYDDKAKKWEDGIAQADLLGKLSDDTRQQYPDWWWGQTADTAIDGRANDLNGMAGQYAQSQSGGRQQTRYSTYGF